MNTAPRLIHRIDALLRRNVLLHALVGDVEKLLTAGNGVQGSLRGFLVALGAIELRLGLLGIHAGRLQLLFRIGNRRAQALRLRNGVVAERILEILVDGHRGLIALLDKAACLVQHADARA